MLFEILCRSSRQRSLQELVLPFRAVDHRTRLGYLPRRISCQPAPVASLPVQRQPKDDSVYPPAEFLRFTQRPEFLVSAQERFLRNIFGVGGIAQNAVSNLKNSPLILSDALAKSRLGTAHFSSRNQRNHARPSHACAAPFSYRHRGPPRRSEKYHACSLCEAS